MNKPGYVYLVGAGSGDSGLLTKRACELLSVADAVLYDRLAPDASLQYTKPDAELIYVGKSPGSEALKQEEINSRLVSLGKQGKTVVRLKGGDPFIFGRGGEEALELKQAGVPFEVVPGVTAGAAVTAYAGIPITQRGISSAVAFITGHEDPEKPESAIDWQALAAFPGTLVFYMGVKQLPTIVEKLVAAGRNPQEPAATVENGTLPNQRTTVSTLQNLPKVAEQVGVKPPAITVVSETVSLHEELDWFENRPLYGKSVAVTRARTDASLLADRLRQLGANAIEAPLIKTEPVEAKVPDLKPYDLICFTSPNGVESFFEKLFESGRDARALANSKVAVIGPRTVQELKRYGIDADIVPKRFVSEGLLEALANYTIKQALIVRPTKARELLAETLTERGVKVDSLVVYKTVAEPITNDQLKQVISADYITFTASSTATYLWEALSDNTAISPTTKLISIGPGTSNTLTELGHPPHIEAAEHSINGVISALLNDAIKDV